MTLLLQIIKRILRSGIIVLSTLILLGLLGFFIPNNLSKEHNCSEQVEVVLIPISSYHIGLAIPTNSVDINFGEEFSPHNTGYIEFGWGDESFYMAEDYSTGNAIRALSIPTNAVMHVVSYNEHPNVLYPNIELKTLSLCPKQIEAVMAHIKNSLKLDEGQKTYLGKGLYGHSAFYKATGKYHVFNTCNSWLAEALREAEIRTPLWSSTSQAVLWHLE